VHSLGTVRRGAAGGMGAAAALPTVLHAAGATVLQEITPLVWVILAISVAGSILTFAVLAYALWKFRDPATKGRRYG